MVRGLRTVLDGRVLASVQANRPDLRRPLPVDLRQRLQGARVTALRRRAKYGLIDTDRGDTAIFHLGMSGRMRLGGEPDKHDHVVFETDDGTTVSFNDARRFGSLDVVPTAELHQHPLLTGLGPEPLGPDLTPTYLAGAFSGRTASVRARLLDQRVVAGLGNIYVAEALHLARIDPARLAGAVKRPQVARLVPAIRDVLEQAIAAGGSSLRDHVQPNGELGYFQDSWRVYGREGEACPACGSKVRRRVDAGRSSFECRRCQR